MIKIILCDDQPSHNDTLKLMISMILNKKGLEYDFPCVSSTTDAVLDYARKHEAAALYFLDICLDEKNLETSQGIDLCKEVLKYSPHSCVIYVSAYQQFALSCCQSHAFDFLVKPFDEVRLTECLSAAIGYIEAEPAGRKLAVQAGSRTVLLDENSIDYIENKREYCIAHCHDDTTVWRESFSSLMLRLSGMFVQIHRGYIINMAKVDEFNFSDDVVSFTGNGIKLPIARRHRAELKKRISEVKIP